VLLGVDGVVMVAEGTAGTPSPAAVATCIAAAADAVRAGLVASVTAAMAGLVAFRRAAQPQVGQVSA
jgi:hypothetical protein